MNVLVTGGRGQLAQALVESAPYGWRVAALPLAALDITDPDSIEAAFARIQPELVVNAAAFTAVDRAESEPDAAFLVNRDGARHLAIAAESAGARLVHVSTDFVFGETAAGAPLRPGDATTPLCVYGRSKLAGEVAVLAAAPTALVLRTAWLYGPCGSNFLMTMLRLMRERDEVRVVADQVGTPSSTLSLAPAIWALAEARAKGVMHYTNAGVASWYDFAQAIAEEALAAGLIARAPRVTPIATSDYPTPARRPAWSVLDKASTWAALGAPAPHWRVALRQVLARLGN